MAVPAASAPRALMIVQVQIHKLVVNNLQARIDENLRSSTPDNTARVRYRTS